MPSVKDGPSTTLFSPMALRGGLPLPQLAGSGISDEMSIALEHAPSGECVGWGIPFEVGAVIALGGSGTQERVYVELAPTAAQWFVFMHTSDLRPLDPNPSGFFSPMRGEGQLGEHAASYVMLYEDSTKERITIRRRHQLGTFQRRWGENCFESVAHCKPQPRRGSHEQLIPSWGTSQMRVTAADSGRWVNWLWAWENPYPDKAVVGVRFEPVSGIVLVSAISAGNAVSQPLR